MTAADDVTAAFALIHATLVAAWKEYVRLQDYNPLDDPSKAHLVLNALRPTLDEVQKAISSLREVHKAISWLGREIAEAEEHKDE